MELYKRYIEEMHPGKTVYQDDIGFAVYWIRQLGDAKEVYIEDIYVLPEHRRNGGTKHLSGKVAEIAKENGCTYMTGTVVPSANHAMISLKMMLSNEFVLWRATENLIWFIKEI